MVAFSACPPCQAVSLQGKVVESLSSRQRIKVEEAGEAAPQKLTAQAWTQGQSLHKR